MNSQRNRFVSPSSHGVKQPTGLWTNQFTYDLARRLYSVASPAGEFDYEYRDSLPSTLVQKLTQPAGAYITNIYDGNARLLGTYLYTSADVLTNKHEYVYNTGNQRTQQTFRDSSTAGFTRCIYDGGWASDSGTQQRQHNDGELHARYGLVRLNGGRGRMDFPRPAI